MEDKFTALFYQASLLPHVLRDLVGARRAVDVVEFKEVDGGKETREMAVPFLPDMDEVSVEQAQLILRAQPHELEADSFSSTPIKEKSNVGFVLSLSKQSRLRKVVFNYPTFPTDVKNKPQKLTYLGISTRPDGPVAQLRLVVRPATRQGSGFTFGPPIFADPPLPAPGELYGPVLVGLSVRDLGNSIEVTLPSLLGTDWLFQFASGEEPTKLSPIDFDTTITRVTIDAAPLNLSLSIQSADGGDILLWSHPDYLLPEMGPQEVNFTPLAQNHLAARLKGQAHTPTLPVPLIFNSAAAGALAITSKTLKARYLVRPFGTKGQTLRLGGYWVPLNLKAPAARAPEEGSARLVVRHLGRELNDGSPVPQLARPTTGLRVNTQTWAARQLTFVPPAASSVPSPLAAVRVRLATLEDAEAVVEVRADAAGSPGQMLAGPLVQQCDKGFSDWLEFELPAQSAVAADGAQIWVCLRSNKGDLLWFADGADGASKISGDRGQTWGAVDPLLAPAAAPLAQLFHATPPSPATPAVALRLGDKVIAENILAAATRAAADTHGAAREFTLDNFTLPQAVGDALHTAVGQGRVSVELKLFSRAVLDLNIERLTLFYSPF
jgi:hypothetical protein